MEFRVPIQFVTPALYGERRLEKTVRQDVRGVGRTSEGGAIPFHHDGHILHDDGRKIRRRRVGKRGPLGHGPRLYRARTAEPAVDYHGPPVWEQHRDAYVRRGLRCDCNRLR